MIVGRNAFLWALVPAFASKAYDVHTYCVRPHFIEGDKHQYHFKAVSVDFNVRYKLKNYPPFYYNNDSVQMTVWIDWLYGRYSTAVRLTLWHKQMPVHWLRLHKCLFTGNLACRCCRSTRNFLRTTGKQTRKEILERVYRGKPKTWVSKSRLHEIGDQLQTRMCWGQMRHFFFVTSLPFCLCKHGKFGFIWSVLLFYLEYTASLPVLLHVVHNDIYQMCIS